MPRAPPPPALAQRERSNDTPQGHTTMSNESVTPITPMGDHSYYRSLTTQADRNLAQAIAWHVVTAEGGWKLEWIAAHARRTLGRIIDDSEDAPFDRIEEYQFWRGVATVAELLQDDQAEPPLETPGRAGIADAARIIEDAAWAVRYGNGDILSAMSYWEENEPRRRVEARARAEELRLSRKP